ncbi:HesA/MoeB/ThiF family protein [Desulfosarcina ovata]|uniref:Thiazole biosynthesis adenylyltransferase ThiF n=1 Tax=Desulfosarcina ovata subsp. ovata TaxID=2752305 RepID=A0A5K8A2Y6_9BACT|nr:HesA/MoeB/ThiF family protein [Desulfosarcina ovata]BBO86872.1 thiazole biosynthesis adenylyltransferase ThiF [Desulfosarcina ovata subsp. ovata]
MNAQKFEKYARQMIFPEIGESGQEKLQDAKVLLIGAGGLGSSCSTYLAAAGVGTVGICDNDMVELSNLNRQILHNPNRIGTLKVNSAQITLTAANPEINIETYPERLKDAGRLSRVVEGYDVIIDCSDNAPTRYIINTACIEENKPWIYGAVNGLEGQSMTIIPGRGPCYRCLYPSAAAHSREAQAAPVIGVTPGIIGIVQAAEAIKLILNVGKALVGRLLFIDLLEMTVAEFAISKNAGCMSCGKRPP